VYRGEEDLIDKLLLNVTGSELELDCRLGMGGGSVLELLNGDACELLLLFALPIDVGGAAE
jgi:hypothetical protein